MFRFSTERAPSYWSGDMSQKENLLRDTWAGLYQIDLRLLLQERIGVPGRYDGNLDVLHLPLARERYRASLTSKGYKSVAIAPDAASDVPEGPGCCSDIEW